MSGPGTTHDSSAAPATTAAAAVATEPLLTRTEQAQHQHQHVRPPPPPPHVANLQPIPSAITTPTNPYAAAATTRTMGKQAATGLATPSAANSNGNNSDSNGSSRKNRNATAATRQQQQQHDEEGGEGEGHRGSLTSLATATATAVVEAEAVKMRPAMIGYFGYMFGGAAIGAFYGIILNEDKGFSKKSVGLLVSVIPLFRIFLLPVLSYIADRHNCATLMLSVCTVGSTVMVFFFATVSGTGSVIFIFSLMVAFETPMNPLLDKHTLLMFPSGPGRTSAWGYVRSYGAYGWGVGNPIAGFLVEWSGTWAIAAGQYAAGQVALLYCMYATKPHEAVDHATSSAVRFKDVLAILFRNRRLLLFLFASCMMGMGYSFIDNFLFIFLADLGSGKFLMGLTLLVTVSTEIPIFQCSDRLHTMLTERQMMTFAMLIWTVRVIGYSFLYRPWLVLLLEPLHGVTFALMWLPGVKLVSEIFPPELTSSATGVLFTFVSGFGAIIGNVVAGFLYDAVGARWMFRIAALAMMVAFTAYQLLDRHYEHGGHLLGKPHEPTAAEVTITATTAEEGGVEGEMSSATGSPDSVGVGCGRTAEASNVAIIAEDQHS